MPSLPAFNRGSGQEIKSGVPVGYTAPTSVPTASAPGNNKAKAEEKKQEQEDKKKDEKTKQDVQTWLSRLFDWIEIRLKRVQEVIDLNEKKASNAPTAKLANEYIDSAQKTVEQTLERGADGKNEYERARDMYYEKADQYLRKAKEEGIPVDDSESNSKSYSSSKGKSKSSSSSKASSSSKSSDSDNDSKSSDSDSEEKKTRPMTKKEFNEIVNGVKNGTINIKEYDEGLQSIIQQYDEWITKGKEMESSLEDQKSKLKELSIQKLSNITDEYSSIQSIGNAEADYYMNKANNVGDID